MKLNHQQQQQLLTFCKQSIDFGLEHGSPMALSIDNLDNELKEIRASFVSLTIQQQLRGCIGCLSAYQALAFDVVHNAYAAAFSDPRFAALSRQQFSLLEYHISILSPSSPITYSSYDDLLSQIRPNIDGLILTYAEYKGTFLPSVWEQLPDKDIFIKHLLNKAGLGTDDWNNNIQISRYTVESIKDKSY